MKASSNTTKWCMIGKLNVIEFLGKDVIFFGRGSHLVFTNLTTKESSTFQANSAKVGDGIKFYTGHRSLNYFAYAECCGDPSIFVMGYPKFQRISVLEGGCREGYISLSFGEASMLISLGSLPYFPITVWDWRKGEKLGSSHSHIYRHKQFVRCSMNLPTRVAQLGTNTTKLHVWDVLVCGKKLIMTHHKVKMPDEKPAPLSMIKWSSDGNLYVLDHDGNVYTMNSEYFLETIIHYNKRGNLTPSFTVFRGELAVTGPTLEVRFYNKSAGAWRQHDSLKPPEPLVNIQANRSDILVGLTDRAYLIRIDPEKKTFDFIKSQETDFQTICLVYPVGEYMCILSQANMVSVIEISTGKVVSKYDLLGTALTMAENPEFPYVGIGYINGILELLSLYDPFKPTVMTSFNLTTNRISSVYFSEFGRVIVAADTALGEFFVLEGIPGGTIDVVATVATNNQIADYMLVPSKNCYRLFVIPVTSREHIKGNKIVRYCITGDKDVTVKEYIFPDPEVYYFRIVSTSKLNRDRVFYVMPFDVKVIQEVETRRGVDTVKILNSYETGHQMQKNGLYIDKHHAVTWASDGFVIARSADFKKTVGIALAHHRRRGGVKKAFIEPLGKYIISLGHDNIVVCTDLVDNEPDLEMQENLRKILKSNRYIILFLRKTRRFETMEELGDYTWLEITKKRKIAREEKMDAAERAAILEEFNEIRNELRVLLNQNIEGPENERLDLVEFDLDTELYEEIKEANRVECQDTEQYIKKFTAAIHQVCQNIKTICFDTMNTQSTKLMGISSHVNVESYALLPPDGDAMEKLLWVQEQLKLEKAVNEHDKFEPWKPMDPQDRIQFLSRIPSLPVAKKSTKIEDFEDDTESIYVDKETIIAMAGSIAQNYIDMAPDTYNQIEAQTFLQLEYLSVITDNDTLRLREYFNTQFFNLAQQKQREILQIKEKNQRLRHIVDEINYHSVDQIYIPIVDPNFSTYEDVDTIVSISDSQVPIKPYISPSEQAILDAKAAEAERLRLLLLADDFRERALMTMMNGVLEVRWEDELKKEVPVPKCMIDKEPEEFNEDDLRLVKDYEEKCKFLNSERERYKNVIDQEYSKIATQIRESVKKFDSRVFELLHLKIKIDEAITQQTLLLCKQRMKLLQRIKFGEKELALKKTIVDNEELIQGIENLINSLQESLSECRSAIEAIQNREKSLEKNLRKDLAEVSQMAQEGAARLLKRRPRVGYRNVNTNAMLQALAKAVVTKERPLALTEDCLEFLNALDHLDEYVNVPQNVDVEAYAVICKHRRFRIEHEIKMKAATTALSDAENSVSLLQRRLAHKKEQSVGALAQLAQVRTDRLRAMKNIQVQMVIKQGYIEVPMNGNISDMKDAVLIPRKVVESINSIILENGRIKLNTMRHSMSFHREIMQTEWKHKKMKMHIQDLKEALSEINSLKLTKEMQTFLKGKEKTLPFEVELEILKNSYENILNLKKTEVKKIAKQVRKIQEDSKKLDVQINDVNVDVCECKLDKDWELDERSEKLINEGMASLAKRGRMVRKIQENHQTILLLQTELELLRLKTYPTIKYKILTDNGNAAVS